MKRSLNRFFLDSLRVFKGKRQGNIDPASMFPYCENIVSFFRICTAPAPDLFFVV
jgi:hypothetical protein